MAKNAEAELRVKAKVEGKEQLEKLRHELEMATQETKKMNLENKLAEASLKKLAAQKKATTIAANKLAESQKYIREKVSAAGEAIGGMISGLARFGTAIGAAVGAIGALVIKSEKFEVIQESFHNLMTVNGQDADKFLAKMTEMTQGTMSQMDMMVAANKAAMFGLPLDKFPEMMKIAKSAAESTGQSMTYMTDSLVLALGRQSKLILDNLNIIVDVDKAYEHYAQTHGKVAESLTETEKKQAFMDAAIQKGLENVKKVGEHTNNLNTSWQVMKARTEDLAISLGQSFVPVMKIVFDLILESIQALSNLASSEFFKSSINSLAKTMNFLGGFFDQIIIQAQRLASTLKMTWGYITFDKDVIAEAKADLKNLDSFSAEMTEKRIKENERLNGDYNRKRIEQAIKDGRELFGADAALAEDIKNEKQKKLDETYKLKEALDKEKRAQEKEDELKNADKINEEKEKKYKAHLKKLEEQQKAADEESYRRNAEQPTIGWSEASGGMAPISPMTPIENMTEGPALPTAAESASAAMQSRIDQIVGDSGTAAAKSFFNGMVQGGEGGAREFLSGLSSGIADAFVPGLGQAVGPLVNMLSQPPEQLKQSLDSFFEAIPKLIENIIENIPMVMVSLAEHADEVIIALVKAVPKITAALIKAQPEVAKALAKEIGNQLGQAGDTISNEVERWGEQFSGFAENLGNFFTEFGSKIEDTFNKIPQAMTDMEKSIEDFPKKVTETMGNAIYDIGEEIKKIPQAIMEGIPELGKEVTDVILQTLNEIAGGLGDLFANIGNILGNLDFGKMVKKLGEGLEDAVKGAMRLITEPINAIIRALNGIKIGPLGWSISAGRLGHWSGDLIPEVDLIPGNIPEMAFNKGGIIPQIQRFASGGTVDTVPAMLTPGEFVVNNAATSRNRDTLEAINSGKSVGSGMVVNINVNGGMLGDATTAREFAKAIDRELLNLRRDNESVAFDSRVV